MTCTYTSGGKDNPITTEIFQYMEDVAPGERNPVEITNVLEMYGVVVEDEGSLILIEEGGRQAVSDINDTARKYFGATGNLLNLTPIGDAQAVVVNMDTLSTVQLLEDPVEDPATNISRVENTTEKEDEEASQAEEENLDEEVEDEMDEDYSEAFARKKNADIATQLLITNLQKQINRLERLPESELTKRRIDELEFLKDQMFKIEKGKAKLDDFLNFTDYVVELTERAQNKIDKIEAEYEADYKTMSQARRAEMLKDISELKETIDAFYSRDKKKSVLNLLQIKIARQMEVGEQRDNLLSNIANAIEDMDAINESYLDTAIPIQADYLMSFAPIELNEQLDAKIKKIKETGQLSGINRLDKRWLKIFLNFTSPTRTQDLLDLNVLQLQEKKLGREQIINELRETHKDASFFSMYADPLVYSNDTSIQLFAAAIKEKLIQANQATIDTKYRLRDEYKKFVEWKGVGEDDVAKLYEDILEEVITYRKDPKTGEYVAFRRLAFVQQYDVSKYNKDKTEFMKKLRERYEFPDDPTKIDDFFKSEKGKRYNSEITAWYAENTEPIENASRIIADLTQEIKTLGRKYAEAKMGENEEMASRYGRMYGNAKFALERVSRLNQFGNRVPVGTLTRPKLSKYKNAKYSAMPREAKQYYDLLLEVYKEDQAKIGKSGLHRNSWEDFSYIVPSVRKSAYDKTREDGFKNSAKDMIKDGFTLQETDTEFGELVNANGERIMAVPRYFTNPVEASLVSKDLTNSIIKFNDMSNRYKYKGEISGVVNVMRAAIANRDVTTLTSTGDITLDSVAQRLGFNLTPPREGKDTNTFKQLDAFIKSVYYGQSMDEDIFNSKISSNKAVSFLTGLTAVSTLSFNLLQAGNQLVIDSAMSAQEGWSSQFYSREDLLWARSKMVWGGEGFGMLTEAALPKFTKKNKILQMMERFDALQQFDEKFGEEAGTAAKKAVSLNSLFFLQTGAELKTTAERMLALSRSYKGKLKDKAGKVLLNESGEEADLWDMLIEDSKGKLIIDPRVANFDETRFVSVLHGVSKRANQLKGSFDRTMMERGHAGRLILMFRKYFVPGYRKRWGYSGGGAAIDTELGQVMEGYYSTAANTISNAFFDMKNKGVVEGIKTLLGKNATADEKANLARFAYEQAVLTSLAIIAMLAQGLLDDDDENWLEGMVGYQMLRLQTELKAFRSPKEFGRMVTSPTATARPVINAYEALEAMANTLIYHTTGIGDPDDIYYQRKSGRYEKGDPKWVKEFLDALPVASGLFKSADPDQARKYYDQFS